MRMYFIALLLPGELNRQVIAMKEYMRERYGCKVASRSPAHLTLVPPFWMVETLKESLIEKLEELAKQLRPFDIEHDGFSSFPQRTIFIASKPNSTLDKLHTQVKDFFRAYPDFPMKFDDRPYHPHVTIATRDLTRKAYQEAWAHFKNKNFPKTWTCSALSLLELSETGWKVVSTAGFNQ